MRKASALTSRTASRRVVICRLITEHPTRRAPNQASRRGISARIKRSVYRPEFKSGGVKSQLNPQGDCGGEYYACYERAADDEFVHLEPMLRRRCWGSRPCAYAAMSTSAKG